MAKPIINYSSEVSRPNITNLLKSVKENKGKSYKSSITLRDLNKWDNNNKGATK